MGYYELNAESVVSYVKSKLDFFQTDGPFTCSEIGDGNLNLVFRIVEKSTEKSLIVKQSVPYVRVAGESWPLDVQRGIMESGALTKEAELVPDLVPKLYFYDEDMCCMVMEDLSDYTIMRYALMEYNQYPHFAEAISDFMVKTLLLTSDVVMEHKEKKGLVKQFINPELCEITEDLVYTEPLFEGFRNNIEESIVQFHKKEIVADEALRLEAAKLKFSFMNNAQALLHGDLHTGSIFINSHSVKVIDPEFVFYGPMAYDIGCIIANLIMNYLSTKWSCKDVTLRKKHMDYLSATIEQVVDQTKTQFLSLWDKVVTDPMAKTPGFKECYIEQVFEESAGVVGLEMLRRTVGFAHVADLDKIEDDKSRYEAKIENLKLAKKFILRRSEIRTGSDYTLLMEKGL